MEANHEAPYAKLAVRFADALAAGDFAAAHAMLTPGLRDELRVETLRGTYEEMIEYGDAPAESTQLIITMEEWADRQPDDAGWAYVAIQGPEFSEAVTAIVGRAGDDLAIRRIEWGRP